MKYRPMLAETITEAQVELMLDSPRWAAEQKLDGHRVVFVNGRPYNRKGEPFKQSMSNEVIEELSDPSTFLPGQTWVFDGEFLDGTYHVFDLLDTPLDGVDMTTPFETRRRALESIFQVWKPFHVSLIGHAVTTHGKRDLLARVVEMGGEGVMFKELDAPYESGRTSAIMKYKLWESADVIVTGFHPEGKRSVKVAAFDGEELVGLGTVTMSDHNLTLVQPGNVIEVKYLYLGAQGALYQPAFLRVRGDKDPYECVVSQLKPVCKDVLTSTTFTTNTKGTPT